MKEEFDRGLCVNAVCWRLGRPLRPLFSVGLYVGIEKRLYLPPTHTNDFGFRISDFEFRISAHPPLKMQQDDFRFVGSSIEYRVSIYSGGGSKAGMPVRYWPSTSVWISWVPS
jgi:hypothetical protein